MRTTPILTADRFALLLDRLESPDRSPSERYEELRERITRILLWKGCAESQADALADVVLDRIAFKIAHGEVVTNLFAYAAGIARFVWLEHRRKMREDAAGDDLPEVAVAAEFAEDDADRRLACLRRCLEKGSSTGEDRRLILDYYDAEPGTSPVMHRRRLAESLGLTMNAMHVRACRLRARLEKCINHCMEPVSDRGNKDTSQQEVA